MIRLVLAEDQAMVRGAIAALLGLESDLEVVAEAGDGEAAWVAVAKQAPDLLVTDIEMPGLTVPEPDAFITWRYGFNLVNHGIWNYNPSTFDPTQAYTNPIYALLSIIPALLGINVVLFFKIISLIFSAYFFPRLISLKKEFCEI